MKRRKFGGAALLLAVMFIIALFAGASGVAASEEPPIVGGGTTATANSLTELLAAINTATDTTTINLTASIIIDAGTLDYGVTEVELAPASGVNITILATSGLSGAMFTVANGYSLVLGKADGTGGQMILDGNKSSVSANGALLDISGTVVLNSGSVLQNNNNASIMGLGGGAVIRSGGELTINETINTSGVINNCKATYGGGIYIESGASPATLNITGGADLSEFVMLRQNTAITDGAGIFAAGSNAQIFLDRNVGFSANDTVYLASGAVLTLKPDFNSESGKIPLKTEGENILGTIVARQVKNSDAAYNKNICFTPNTELGDEKFYSIAAKESTDKLSTEWYIDWTYVTLTLQAEPLIGQSFPANQFLIFKIEGLSAHNATYTHTVCLQTELSITKGLNIYGLQAGKYRITQSSWSYRYRVRTAMATCRSTIPTTFALFAPSSVEPTIIADTTAVFISEYKVTDACMALEFHTTKSLDLVKTK